MEHGSNPVGRGRPGLRRIGRTHLGLEALEARLLLRATYQADDPTLEREALVVEAREAFLAAVTHPLSSVPPRSSLPGAADTLYLDFDGFFEAQWGSHSDITTPAYDRDGDPTTFSDDELASIESIWARVAEDFAPFNLNVTTVEPPSFANGVALRVAIGGKGAWTGGNYGGIAFVNSFTNGRPNTVYVFSKNLANGNPKATADAAAHEAGHGFGLEHQSLYNAAGKLIDEYYEGPDGKIAPLMGNSYEATRSLWWQGTTASATTIQDDMAVLARPANGFGYRADDHGDTAATATPLDHQGTTLEAYGIIATTSDADFFSFDTTGGQVSLAVRVSAGINNLDARLELLSAGGAIAPLLSAPANSFDAALVANLPAGAYMAVVRSQGNYGDVGQYVLSVTAPWQPVAPTVVAEALFYNQSSFDGNDPAAAAADDAAIALDKVAYRPGDGLITPQSMTSYARGINGVMIDVAGFAAPPTLADFTFRVSGTGLAANNSPDLWQPAPAPREFVVRAGAGLGGSDRVEIIWPDAAIANCYLQVIVEGHDEQGGFNTHTGLANSHVFFYGSKIGDTFLGTSDSLFVTGASDESQARNNLGSGVPITSPYDFDRNGFAGAANDQFLTRQGFGLLARIRIDAASATFVLATATVPVRHATESHAGADVVRAPAPLAADGEAAAAPPRVERYWQHRVGAGRDADEALALAWQMGGELFPGLSLEDEILRDRLDR